MDNKKTIQALLIAVIISSSMLAGAVALTFFTKQMDSTITIVANGYAVTLYSDSDLTNEMTTFSFSQLMAGIDAHSDWVEVYVKFDDNPASKVYGHITTSSIPNGLVVIGQTYRFQTGLWDDLDVDDNTCDFTSDPTDDTYVPRLRFRVERTDSALGTFMFQTVFTITDSSIN